jgi:drug/metabolite transporter (DMT)-like permease
VFAVSSIFCDGLIGRFQGQIRNKYRPTSFQMMESVSFITLIGAVLLNVVLGETKEFLDFLLNDQEFQWNWIMFSLLGAMGQIFIYYTITTFGPLFCGFVTTTRKMMTIIFSILVFNHTLSQGQWGGVVLVFVGVMADFLMESMKPHGGHGHGHKKVEPSEKIESTASPTEKSRSKRD